MNNSMSRAEARNTDLSHQRTLITANTIQAVLNNWYGQKNGQQPNAEAPQQPARPPKVSDSRPRTARPSRRARKQARAQQREQTFIAHISGNSVQIFAATLVFEQPLP